MAYVIEEYFDCFDIPHNGIIKESNSNNRYWFRFIENNRYELSTVDKATIDLVRSEYNRKNDIFVKMTSSMDNMIRVTMKINPLSIRGDYYKVISISETITEK